MRPELTCDSSGTVAPEARVDVDAFASIDARLRGARIGVVLAPVAVEAHQTLARESRTRLGALAPVQTRVGGARARSRQPAEAVARHLAQPDQARG